MSLGTDRYPQNAAARDPLTDPKAGDVVIYGPQWQRERVEVLAREAEIVRYEMSGNALDCTLPQWRDWMRSYGAEVLNVAD